MIIKQLYNFVKYIFKIAIKNKVFYKERWIKEDGLEQKYIVTFSLKYKYYQQQIRNNQIERAQKAMHNKNFKLEKCNQNNYKRFITKTAVKKRW